MGADARVVEGRDSPESYVDLHRGSRGLPPPRRTPLPGKPWDMPQSLCGLDHAGTGREGNSAKREREREKRAVMG